MRCSDSLLPSAVEEVYIKQLINKCKAWCASGLISNQTLLHVETLDETTSCLLQV